MNQPRRPLRTRRDLGDAVYFVFSNVRDAGRFALDLRDRVRNTDWASKELPNINLRVGLHVGPVYLCTNPVTVRAACVGPHVSRAARIEPITPPGQVYASSAFAAVAAASGTTALDMRYVGKIPLAKSYGSLGLYHILPR
jgi:class 3 adenylate cyclase